VTRSIARLPMSAKNCKYQLLSNSKYVKRRKNPGEQENAKRSTTPSVGAFSSSGLSVSDPSQNGISLLLPKRLVTFVNLSYRENYL
jgi:hypothetical protein